MKGEILMRKQLVELLEGTGIHAVVKRVVEGIPPEVRAKRVRNLPYTLWQLLEHVRLTQHDILNYMTDAEYEAPEWPDSYWPTGRKPSGEMWEKSVRTVLRELGKIKSMAKDPKIDLFASVPCGEKEHTLFREVLVLAGHNAYHLGQMVVLRRLMGIWN
jgi:DinB superfamily